MQMLICRSGIKMRFCSSNKFQVMPAAGPGTSL